MFSSWFTQRANQTHQWNPSDSEEAYRLTNSGGANYTKDDIEYTFNSHGFRSAEFSEKSDFPLLFMGYSFTEGIGLPINHTWAYFLLELIKKDPRFAGKRIPHWSIALGGSGVDTQALQLHNHINQIAPKYAIMLVSSYYRREYCYSTPMTKCWLPTHTALSSDHVENSLVTKIFTDEYYSLYETYRSLMIISLTLRRTSCTLLLVSPAHFGLDEKVALGKLCETFDNIIYVDLTPAILTHQTQADKELLDQIADAPVKARDNMHSGALWNLTVATAIWNKFSNIAQVQHRSFKQPPSVSKQ